MYVIAITPKHTHHRIKQEMMDEDDIEDEGEQLRKEVLQKNKLQDKVRLVKARHYPLILGDEDCHSTDGYHRKCINEKKNSFSQKIHWYIIYS